MSVGAAARWASALGGWGYPDEVLAAAPADPWSLDPEELPAAREDDDRGREPSPADELARAALPRGGSVLDVGCGPGGASVHLRDRASSVTGVDTRRAMLEEFDRTLTRPADGLRRLVTTAPEVATVEGRWPDVADEVGTHDVVVCHNTLYNVSDDVARFVARLDDRARHLVVVVVTQRHPLSWLTPYVEQLHGLRRPSEPTDETAVDVVGEVTGAVPRTVSWTVERRRRPAEQLLRVVARRCAVGEDRFDELRGALRRVPPPTRTTFTAMAWAPGGTGSDLR